MKKNEGLVWKEYFDSEEIEYDYDYYAETAEDADDEGFLLLPGKEKFKIMRYPYIVVDQWCSKVLSEPPHVQLGDKELLTNINYKKVLSYTLGYGEVIVIPYFINDKTEYDIIPACDVDYVESDGELKELSYTETVSMYNIQTKRWQDVRVNYNYLVVNDKTSQLVVSTGRVQNVDTSEYNTITEYKYGFIPPFIVKANSLMGLGIPVYAKATGIIDDLNANDYEKFKDRELSRKQVLIPDTRVEKKGRGLGNIGFVNKKDRLLRLIPGTDTENQMPLFIDGQFNPDKYIKDQNQLLHMLSLSCGFGAKYLSYDETSGGTKTTTEVYSEKSDLYQNKKMHDVTLNEIIKKLFRGYNILSGAEYIDPELLEITFSDNIIQDDNIKKEDALKLYQADAIDQQTLLKAFGYTDSEINDIVDNTNVAQTDTTQGV